MSAPVSEGDNAAFDAAHIVESLAERMDAHLAQLPTIRRIWVALSGGADSLALLHALGMQRARLAPAEIAAVHVHHGLQDASDEWESACRRICTKLRVPLEVVRVEAGAARGESPEAAARRARYTALADLAGPDSVVCCAHHQGDQAETLLLQLMRGSGPAGLAGMPAQSPLGEGWLLRPLLDASREDLRDYLRSHGIEWIEDPSNADTRFDRNYLRHEIFPLLARRWPGARRTLTRAAAHQADSVALADALARIDRADCRGSEPGTLSRSALLALPQARARNLLRAWIGERGLPPGGAAHVEGIMHALLPAREDAEPLVNWPGAEVRRYRDALYALAPLPAHDASLIAAWTPASTLELPYGRLESAAAEGRGLDAERCRRARLEVRFRQGGERFRPAGRAHSTALKKLLQASAVPPWLRHRVPLIYVDDELAAVAGLWVGESFGADARSRGWLLRWTELPGMSA